MRAILSWKNKRGGFLLLFLLLSLGGSAWLYGELTGVPQPIAFPHETHVKTVGLQCVDCHPGVETSIHAQLPDLDFCLGCHQEPQKESKEEAKIRELAKLQHRPVFNKLFRFPNHVYYSHRRHVGIAKLACSQCHGAIAETTAPPSRPLVAVTMSFCLDCHEEKGVTTDCIACHR